MTKKIDPGHARNREIASSKLAHAILTFAVNEGVVSTTARQLLDEIGGDVADLFMVGVVRSAYQGAAGLPTDPDHYSAETWESAFEKARIAWNYADSVKESSGR
jgi:hypothetical protein